jgi:hypothetical protein
MEMLVMQLSILAETARTTADGLQNTQLFPNNARNKTAEASARTDAISAEALAITMEMLPMQFHFAQRL